ncbi:damage-inducible protein CinA [Cephaloticoccus capnophilus]|uniref:CinA-like protein n=1 Tax=Cephaloticoccus capnophilus TaxID=1548208 RepID=A0A139SLC5_9BACT|nr:CinA family nicotinamide mononucleotide deamidase-related protein [Cephaloticoccus capnophilus]KXU35290.1 damage-inducible protein CinA [Cephaloticoccus capnophilus]
MSTPEPSPTPKAIKPRRFELITLGDELLLGLTANSHLTFIGGQLGRRGVQLARNVTITDEAGAIERQFRESWAGADVVITSGGLGPTCDDRTREVIAEVLGQSLVFEPIIEAAIMERFNRFGLKTLPPNNLKQAYRLEGGDFLPNAHGTAPGLWFEEAGKVLCMLPGPPNELQPMFTEQVLPRLAERGFLLSGEAYVQLRTAGIGESELEARLQPVFDAHGGAGEDGPLSVAFCAHAGQVDCRLSSPSGLLTSEQLQAIAAQCEGLLGEDFMCYGEASLAKVCVDLLRAGDKTLAVAEAGTGGLLTSEFGEICGVAKCFLGALVCNSNEAKVTLLDCPECLISQHGAVSAECAVALATGVAERLGADYALSITAFSGAPCANERGNEVGTIFVGLHAPDGVWARKLSYPGPRRTIKTRAVNAALDWLRRELVRANARSAEGACLI